MRNIQIAAVVFLSLLTASSAFGFGEIRYADRPLNLRDGRSAKAKWIGNMYPGQKVRIAHLKNGWVAVYEPDATDPSESAAAGFSNVRYLIKERTRHEPQQWGELQGAIRAVNVRARADVRSRKLMTLKSGDRVLTDFPDGDWIMVFKPTATIRSQMNAIGYCSAKYFRPATSRGMADTAGSSVTETIVTEQPAAATTETVSGTGQVAGAVTPPLDSSDFVQPRLVQVSDTINVYADRTSGAALVRTLKPGDKVKVGQPKHGWYGAYGPFERVHSQSRPMGYVLQAVLDKASKSAPEPLASNLKSTAKPQPVPNPQPVTAPVSEAQPRPAAKVATQAVKPAKSQQTMVIDRKAFVGKKRPDPTPDKTAHGYRYRLMEKTETRQFGQPWIMLKVFLSTNKLPERKALQDFATTLWKEHRRVTKKVAVQVFLPGMDTEGLAYGVIKFDDEKMLELWVRKATLFGTAFM